MSPFCFIFLNDNGNIYTHMKSLDASKTNLKHFVGMSHIGTVDEDESYRI